MRDDEARSVFLGQQNSTDTQATYARGIEMFDAFLGKPYAEVTDQDLVAWKESLAGYASATQSIRWTAVRSFYEWMVRAGHLPSTPFAVVRGPRKIRNRTPRIPSEAAFMSIVDWPGRDCETPRDWRDRAILRLLANGLRISEVVGLDNDSLAFDAHHQTHLIRILGKGGRERIVPITDATRAIVDEYTVRRTDSLTKPGDPLFVDPVFETRMTRRQVQAAFDRRRRSLGVEGEHFSAHSLRHHYATRLIRSGASVFSVQRLLGHESVSTTQVYVNLDISDTVIASRLDPVA